MKAHQIQPISQAQGVRAFRSDKQQTGGAGRACSLTIMLLGLSIISAPAAPTPTELAKQVQEILTSRCVVCHGLKTTEPKTSRAKKVMDDLKQLSASEYVNLKSPEDSDLWKSVTSDQSMPKLTKAEEAAGKKEAEPLSAEQAATILAWIKAGAPLVDAAASVATAPAGTPTKPDLSTVPLTAPTSPVVPAAAKRQLVTPADEITEALKFLQSLSKEDQADVRFVSLSPQWNDEKLDEKTLENLRRGVRKMLNSLSTAPRIASFVEVGAQKTLFALKLRDLNWDKAQWDRVASFFPQSIDTGVSSALGSACNATVPILRADWMAANATRPPLYHDILKLPKQQAELEKMLGVNVAEDLRTGRAMRAGFASSGVSFSNRTTERHDLAGGGSYHLSYDAKSSAGQEDQKKHPLGPAKFPDGTAVLLNDELAFKHAGGEFVFTLPNGLHGYYVADVLGNRLDGPAPTNVVIDKDGVTGRGEISNGLSCIICHQQGLKVPVPRDEVRALAKSFDVKAQKLIELIYPESAVYEAKLKEDVEGFLKNLKAAGAEALPGQSEPVGALAKRFDDPVSLETAAAELGMLPADFLKQIDAAPSLNEVRITFQANRTFQRDAYLDRFPEIVERLGNGTVRKAQPLVVVGAVNKVNPPRPVAVALSLDKANYADGEEPIIVLDAAEDCHLRLLYQDARGDITILYPNDYIQNDQLRAGKSRLLPAPNPKKPGDEVAIQIFGGDNGKVFGTERFIAIASTEEFKDTKQLLADAQEAFQKTKSPFATVESGNLELAMTKAARAITRSSKTEPTGNGNANAAPASRIGFSVVTITTHAK